MDKKQIIEQFKRDYQYRLSDAVLQRYETVVTLFLSYTEKKLSDIHRKDIRDWMGNWLDQGYNPGTVYNNLSGLKTFFKYCVEEDLLDQNPAKDVRFPKMEEKLPRYLTREQLAQLRTLNEGKILDRAIIEVLYTTGIRVVEMVNMKQEDINWNERFIIIPDTKEKKERLVMFTRECAEYLKRHQETTCHTSPYVFVSPVNHPKPYSTDTIRQRFEGYSNQLDFKVTPHLLRHTFAAHLAQKNMPIEHIQQLLGHSSIDTTRIYARLYDQARKEQYDEWR
ncbi:tyrosine-type recombinase/integrase [Sporosarcina ureae]|uniref:Integrase n=1 Tax=Sporosarcina ureae TaxID=1571 RepID=A0ABN4YY61_SPOUR|nr:tyrosine-type recombinase/integrase [Sporosarcina ureae]ARF14900.1 hypothetical protein SporoS204_12500 [Sporosarcina ureae]